MRVRASLAAIILFKDFQTNLPFWLELCRKWVSWFTANQENNFNALFASPKKILGDIFEIYGIPKSKYREIVKF